MTVMSCDSLSQLLNAIPRSLEDKSIAVIGLVEVGLENGEKIDGFDAVVRLTHQHALAYEPRYFGSNYLAITEEPQLQATVVGLGYVMYGIGEQFLLLTVAARKRLKSWYYLVAPFLLDLANSIQQVLMDLLRFLPVRIKVLNSNYISLNYMTGYFAGRLLLSPPTSVHDPVSSFLFYAETLHPRLIEADSVLARVLKVSEVE